MDEITLFTTIQPPPPADGDPILQGARARLTAEMARPARPPRPARHRRNQFVLVTCAAVAATCAAIIGSAVVPSGSNGLAGAQAEAYVVLRHVQGALARENLVMHERTTQTGTYAGERPIPAVNSNLAVTWSYGARSRYEEFTPAGKRYLADGTAMIGGRLRAAYVTYFDRKWSGGGPPGAGLSNACGKNAVSMGGPVMLTQQWPAFIKATIACGAATVTGRAWIDGVHTIKITGSPVTTGLPKGMVRATKARVRYILYVNPSTYLPLRMDGSTTSFGGGTRPWRWSTVTYIQWLPPTKANIAEALVKIPRGYRHVTSPADQ